MPEMLGPYPLDSIVTGDAIELTRMIPSESVDLVLTSPPYNLRNEHHTGNFRHSQYDDNLPEDVYQAQQAALLSELYRIVKPGGSLIYNHKNRISGGVNISPYQWLLLSPWIVKQELVWFNKSQNFDKIRFYPMTERVYWMAKRSETKLVNAIGHHDVFDWKAVGTKGKHTRAFPEQMVLDFLACFPSALIILDPYGGSGTVPAVCKMLNRRYLAFEIDPDTAELARQRVAMTQPPLVFPEPEQLSIKEIRP